MTAGKFYHWLESAQRGSRFIYHKGFLARDRDAGLAEPSEAQVSLVQLAGFALTAAARNQVHLFQRKLGLGSYEYIAVKT